MIYFIKSPDGPIICADCRLEIDDAPAHFWVRTGNTYCQDCTDKIAETLRPEAEVHAIANCRITARPFPEYDGSSEFRPTHEEYASGMREAYSPNSFRAYLWHNCTNYEELIRTLDRKCPFD